LLGHRRVTGRVTTAADVLVVGAGIVGAACARALHDEGMKVALIDAGVVGGGVTAAGMGHLVVLDESDDELDLCLLSMRLWQSFAEANPGVGEFTRSGTLWVAENESQLARARERAARLRERGCAVEDISADDVTRVEPLLRHGLAGGVRVMSDALVYGPSVTYALVQQLLREGCVLHAGRRVVDVGTHELAFDDGSHLSAQHIVVAAGSQVAQLLPEVPVFPRKGHIAVTDRYPGRLTHQIVSMNYGQTEAGADGFAVAANVQPRPTGQWLIGSSRQEGRTDTAIDRPVLEAVLQGAIALVPALAQMRIIRSWAGMRPATPDGHPIIGPHASRPGVWLAAGHEGLGITTCFATARVLADQIAGRTSEINIAPYLPARFAGSGYSPARFAGPGGAAHAH
jgi:glycine/D-amino acid oxidase-like deaminating enzyme